jgi:hypothetical protein
VINTKNILEFDASSIKTCREADDNIEFLENEISFIKSSGGYNLLDTIAEDKYKSEKIDTINNGINSIKALKKELNCVNIQKTQEAFDPIKLGLGLIAISALVYFFNKGE